VSQVAVVISHTNILPQVHKLLFSQSAVLQVTTLLLNLAGVAHVVDAASAGYTKSVSPVYWLHLLASSTFNLALNRTLWLAVATASGLRVTWW